MELFYRTYTTVIKHEETSLLNRYIDKITKSNYDGDWLIKIEIQKATHTIYSNVLNYKT